MPRDSALARAIHDDESVEWTITDYLLAEVADRIGLLLWQNGGDKHAPKPGRIPRPGLRDDGTPARRHRQSAEEIDDVLERLRAQTAAQEAADAAPHVEADVSVVGDSIRTQRHEVPDDS